MCLREVCPKENAPYRCPKMRTVQEVILGAHEGMLDGLPRRFLPRDALVQLFRLADGECAPGDRGTLTRGDEALGLRKREAHFLKEPQQAHRGDGVDRIPPMTRDTPGRSHQSELVVVAQCRGRYTRSAGELTNREEFRHPGFKCTRSRVPIWAS